MSTFTPANKIRPSQVLGGVMGWLDETSFEMETPSISSTVKTAGGVVEDFFSLVGDIAGVESKGGEQSAKFPSKGSIEFNKKEQSAREKLKQKEESDRKKSFYQALEQNRLRARQAKDKMWLEEEINDITANLSTNEKNRLLHYQAGYKDRSVYQMAELRRKVIEEKRLAEKQKKEASVAETKPRRASAMNAAFEGGSGTQGAGQANLSAHATG